MHCYWMMINLINIWIYILYNPNICLQQQQQTQGDPVGSGEGSLYADPAFNKVQEVVYGKPSIQTFV